MRSKAGRPPRPRPGCLPRSGKNRPRRRRIWRTRRRTTRPNASLPSAENPTLESPASLQFSHPAGPSHFEARDPGLDPGAEVAQPAINPGALDHVGDGDAALLVEGDIGDAAGLGRGEV